MPTARVLSIFIAFNKGLPMVGLWRTDARTGVGLAQDRYARRRGSFSEHGTVARHVTLIEFEALLAANSELDVPFLPDETRRNIVTEGVGLNSLVGVEFTVGGVRMRGVELCEPCKRPANLVSKKHFETAFAGRGGLRAKILSDGVITVGDSIQVV